MKLGWIVGEEPFHNGSKCLQDDFFKHNIFPPAVYTHVKHYQTCILADLRCLPAPLRWALSQRELNLKGVRVQFFVSSDIMTALWALSVGRLQFVRRWPRTSTVIGCATVFVSGYLCIIFIFLINIIIIIKDNWCTLMPLFYVSLFLDK